MNNKVNPEKPSWRDYQAKRKYLTVKKKSLKNTLKVSAASVILVATFCVTISGFGSKAYFYAIRKLNPPSEASLDAQDIPDSSMDKRDVQDLLDGKSLLNLKDKSFNFVADGLKLQVDTSLDIGLQHYLLKNLNLSTSRYIGIVGMDPATGRILSMVGYDKADRSGNPCVDSRFPAASIFKIVTAAAAIEKHGFNLDSKFTYNGRKHTLYKSQLKNRSNRYTNRITFSDSFAQSVNPVFGKIGVHYLGKTTLENYAAAFGFNRNIDFEIQLAPSQVFLSDDPYQWAEIASGFNRQTKMSPLHGALITAVILNQGRLVEPTIVDQIKDENGRVMYRSQMTTINQAITPATSKIVNHLMETTIISGTCKKTFRGFENDRILSRLNIGGKSGSIGSGSHDARYDWFVGFAEEKEGPAKIVISAVVAHEKYIGTRASQYARMAIKQYFSSYFANNATVQPLSHKGTKKENHYAGF